MENKKKTKPVSTSQSAVKASKTGKGKNTTSSAKTIADSPVKGKTFSEILKSEKKTNPILSCNDLHVSFKTDEGLVHAVRGVSFDLYKGETLCIVGESGSGKSVTSKTIMGILSSSAVIEKGSVIYEGEDLTKIDESEFHRIRGHKIGMIFQDPLSSLNPIMRVGKQITEAMLVNSNLIKRMKDSHIAKEQAAYNNIRVERDMVYTRCDHRLDECESKYKSMIYALENKVSEAKFALDSLERGTEEYEAGLARIAEAKQILSVEKKKIKAEMKAERSRLVKEGKLQKREANKIFKEKKPALQEALTLKKKEADLIIGQYKAEKNAAFAEDMALLKKELKAAQTPEAKKEVNNKIALRKEKHREDFKITRAQAKAKALQVMKEVGIPQPEIRFKQYPFEFSGGMRQRIVIAIALTANPEILICDEPTTALDVTIQAQILELINRLKKEYNMSIIFITHDLGVVANMADRVAVMYAGKIIEVGTVNEIFYDPRHPYTWALLSSIPDLDSKEKLEAIPGTPPYLLNPPKGDAFAARNKYAMKIDFEQEPPFFKVSDTHYASTWLLDKRAPKTEKPKIVSRRIEVSLERAGVKHD